MPALYNGFPLVFHDTGAYLARAFEADLEPGRAPFYGLLIAATGGAVSLWPVILLQVAATLWLLMLTLRLNGAGKAGALWLLLLLPFITTIAWGAATVMPDAFAPLAVLAWYLLVYHGAALERTQTVLLSLLLLLSCLVHITHVALILGLTLCPGLWLLLRRKERRRGALLAAGVALAALTLVPVTNYLLSDYFGFTPGGQTFIFGRLVQSGLIERYLDEHCPSSEIRLCAYRGALPPTGDDWIWDSDSPFEALGGWNGYRGEMASITRGSLQDHPWLHLKAAAAAAVDQFFRVGTGDDIDARYWHTDQIVSDYLPRSLASLTDGRQHRGQLGAMTSWLNRLYAPLTYGALALTGLALAWRPRDLRPLLSTILLALIGNAVLCGVFSGPHDRYQGRMAWLAVFAVGLVAVKSLQRPRASVLPPL